MTSDDDDDGGGAARLRDLADDALLGALNALWRERDPAPPGLSEQMVAAVASAEIEEEWALLTLVAAAEPAEFGARGDDLTVIEFTGRGFHVLLRLSSPTPEGAARRIDGWVSPAAPGAVHLRGARPASAVVDPDGRFVLDDVSSGVVSLRFELASGLRHESPTFAV